MYSARARSKRGRIFRDYLRPTEQDRILDLGGATGAHLAGIVPFRRNVHVADISPDALADAEREFGFKGVLLDETGRVPFPDSYFDIVFCSSVIEHVTVDKEAVDSYQATDQFVREAFKRQREFAKEIQRIGRRYFVQTPNKYFPIESHTWLPVIVVFLPRGLQIGIITFMNKWWPKKTIPDWNLLTKAHMRELFPDAEIVVEKSFGFTKSVIAVRR
jgi:SAM-dependent methyltransferase